MVGRICGKDGCVLSLEWKRVGEMDVGNGDDGTGEPR